VTISNGVSAIANSALSIAQTNGLTESIVLPSLVAFFGDSIIGQGQSNTPEGSIFPGNLFPGWVKFTLNGRIDFLTRNEFYGAQTFGYSGYKINDLRGTVLSDGVTTDQGAVAVRSAALIRSSNGPLAQLLSRISEKNVLIVEMSGTNDVISDIYIAASFHATKRGNLWREMIAAGIPAKRIVALELPPIGGNAGRMTQVTAVNALCAADAATLGIYWLPYPTIMLSAGTANAGYYRQDLIHPNTLGAKTFGENVAAFISSMVSTTAVDIPISSDPRWLTPNPNVTGSTGVAGTGSNVSYFGNIATSWVASAPSANVTATFSKIVNAANQNILRVVVSGTNRQGSFGLIVSSTNAALPAGTSYRIVARLKGSGFSNINIMGVSSAPGAVGVNVQLAQDSSFASQDNTLDLGDFDGVFESPVVQTSNAQSSTSIALWFNFSGQGTVDISQAGILEVLPFPTRPSLPLNTATVAGSYIGSYTVKTSDSVLFGDASITNPMIFTLPLAASVTGKQFRLKKIDASAGVVRFATSGGQTIDGAATADLTKQWETVEVTSNGNNYFKDTGAYLALSGGTVTGNIDLLGTMTATGNIGIGAASPSAKLHSVATTEQLRLGYDNSNYISATVSSLGRVTLDAVGASGATGAGFILAKQTQLTGQTIVDNNSAITKGWVGMASQMNQSNIGANGLWALITTAQAGTYLGSNTAGEIRLDAADATNFGSITVNLGAFSGIGPTSSLAPNRQPNFNFSNRVGFSFFIKSTGDSFNPSLQSWAYAIGSYDSFASHTIQSLYPLNQSTGGYRAYICVTCINGEVVLRVSDRTANRVDSIVLDTITGVFGKNYAVIVEGGIASLYRDNTYLGSVSGATTHADCNGAVGGAFFHHSASAVGTATRRRVSIYNGRAWW
jgi:lysophospholipase L1-like esterase